MTRTTQNFLYIISRDRPDLYLRIAAEFADMSNVTVMLDRRIGPRRTGPGMRTPERRGLNIHEDLETLGWAIVPVIAAYQPAGDSTVTVASRFPPA